MTDFQIAFQGGGARLADLLAAAEILQAAERDGRIRIRRVAGTSAGAIAAAVVAFGGQSAKDVRAYLQTHGKRLVQKVSGTSSGEIKFKTVGNVLKLWRGRPLLGTNGLREVLTEVLQVAFASGLKASSQSQTDPQRTTVPLKFEHIIQLSDRYLFVVAADLVKQEPVVYPESGNDIVDALVDSAAVPFVFRGHGELVANARVDGGLCQNLPSDVLLPGTQQFGEVLAISFAQKVDGRAPESFEDYVEALISTAINGAVTQSASRLPQEAVLPLQSSLSTFDFAKAFAYPSEDRGASVQLKTQDWISNRARQTSPAPPASAVLEEAMTDLFQWYRAIQNREPRRSLKSVLLATANCCKARSIKDAEADGVVKEYHFAPQKVPMTVFHVMAGVKFRASGIRIDVRGPHGRNVIHRRVPALDRRQDKAEFGYVLLFDEPLQPLSDDEINKGMEYLVRVMYTEQGGLAGLLSPKNHDYIIHRNNRSEKYEFVNVILRIPRDFRVRCHAVWSDQSGSGLAEPLDNEGLRPYDNELGFTCRGWRVRDFPQGRELRIDLNREIVD